MQREVRVLGKRQSTGKEQRMKEPYGEGEASHTGPSSARLERTLRAVQQSHDACQ